MVKSGSKEKFLLGFTQALDNLFLTICIACTQAAFQLLQGGRLHKDAHGLSAIYLTDTTATGNIHIEDYVLSCLELTVNLRTKCTIEAIGIDLLVLQEFPTADVLTEFLGEKKK